MANRLGIGPNFIFHSKNTTSKMKKILLPLFFMTAAVLLTLPAQAQKKISDGFVKYELADIKGDNLPPQVGMMKGSKLDVYFKGDKQKVSMNFMNGMMAMQVFKMSKEDPGTVLTDMMGNKTMVKQDKEDAVQNKVENMKVDAVKGASKEIAGYKCQKAIVTTANGDKMEIYYTDKIQPTASYFDEVFPGLDGFPLEYRIKNQGITMVYSATEVSGSLPDGSFDIPEGYKEMSAEEFKKQMGGMGNLGF